MINLSIWVSEELFNEIAERAKKENRIVPDYINHFLSENLNQLYICKLNNKLVVEDFRKKKNMN